MPYRIEERDGKFCVVKKDDGATIHCHDTQEQAEAQMRALYAHEKALLYVPFVKMDEEQRLVYGLATDETPDIDGEVVDYAATKAAVADWSQWRNVREMHGPSAVGVAEEIMLDDTAKSLSIGVKVVDDDAWSKVKAGVYKGFSIGGRKLKSVMEKVGGRQVNRIVEYLLTEISLVDRPANPAAVFSLVKREGGETEMEPEKSTEEEQATEQATIEKAVPAEETPVEETPAEEAPEAPAEESLQATLTPEGVKGIVTELLDASSSFAKAATVDELAEAVQGLASTPEMLQKVSGDLNKMVGDLAKVAQAVDALDDRITRIEQMPAGTGPVLREIQATGMMEHGEAVLKALFDETTDPALKDMLGRKLTELSIRAAKRNEFHP